MSRKLFMQHFIAPSLSGIVDAADNLRKKASTFRRALDTTLACADNRYTTPRIAAGDERDIKLTYLVSLSELCERIESGTWSETAADVSPMVWINRIQYHLDQAMTTILPGLLDDTVRISGRSAWCSSAVSLRGDLAELNALQSPYYVMQYINRVRLEHQIKRLKRWKEVYREDSPFYNTILDYGMGQSRTRMLSRYMVAASTCMVVDDYIEVHDELKRRNVDVSWKWIHLTLACYGVAWDVKDIKITLNKPVPISEAVHELNVFCYRRRGLARALIDWGNRNVLPWVPSFDDWYYPGVPKEPGVPER